MFYIVLLRQRPDIKTLLYVQKICSLFKVKVALNLLNSLADIS